MLTSYADVVAGQIENMLLAKESGLFAPLARDSAAA
jgi:hypothetical protein